jgi:signal transduction histidine kinase/HAMP domain-containing protein
MADMQAVQRAGAAADWLQARTPARLRGIGSRLIAGFLLLIVPTLVLGVFAVQRFDLLAGATTDLASQDLPAIVTTDHLRNLLFQQKDLEQLAWANQSLQGPLSKEIDTDAAALAALELPGKSPVPSTAAALVKTLVAQVAHGDTIRARIATLVARNHIVPAQTLVTTQLIPSITSELSSATKLKALEESTAAATAGQVQQEAHTGTQIVLLVTLLSMPLSTLLALLLIRSLLRPLSALLHATAVLASGDLRESPRLRSGDEIGQLADAFDTMRVNLRGTIAALALERRQTQAIIDACADGMVLVDHEHHILQANPAAGYLTGRDAPTVVGRQWWEVFGICGEPAWVTTLLVEAERKADSGAADCPHCPDSPSGQEDCPLCRVTMPRLMPPERASRQLPVQLPTGEQRWLSVSCASIPGDHAAEDRRMIVSLHDVSQFKAVDQLKSDFVAMVSHELRAPVTTVAGAVELLQQLNPEMHAGPQQEVLDILTQQTLRLRMVVDEVLQVTRLEAGRLPVRLQSLRLVTFIQALIERLRLEWRNGAPTEITVNGLDLAIWGDPAMLEIVFRNLLDNARKYAPSGSSIEIEIEQVQGSNQARIRISDQGPGISPDQLEYLFERFSRGSASAASWTRGYGLGLYIVRELLRAHNGQITAENRLGGTCFIFTLCTVAESRVPDQESAVII